MLTWGKSATAPLPLLAAARLRCGSACYRTNPVFIPSRSVQLPGGRASARSRLGAPWGPGTMSATSSDERRLTANGPQVEWVRPTGHVLVYATEHVHLYADTCRGGLRRHGVPVLFRRLRSMRIGPAQRSTSGRGRGTADRAAGSRRRRPRCRPCASGGPPRWWVGQEGLSVEGVHHADRVHVGRSRFCTGVVVFSESRHCALVVRRRSRIRWRGPDVGRPHRGRAGGRSAGCVR